MHILFIPSWYSTPDNPIRGSFFRDQALALAKAGHQVGILVPPSRLRTWHGLRQMRHNWRHPSYVLEVELDAGLAIYRIPWWGWKGTLLRSERAALGLAAFDRYCQEQGQPDIVHGQSLLYGGYLAAVIKRQRGIPAVVTEHSSVYIRGPILPDQRPALALHAPEPRPRSSPSPTFWPHQLWRAMARLRTSTSCPNIVDIEFFSPADTAAAGHPCLWPCCPPGRQQGPRSGPAGLCAGLRRASKRS